MKYIGLDTHNNPKYLGSGIELKQALAEYGKENFKKEILEECVTLAELRERELFWINKFDAYNSSEYYNLTASRTPVEHRKGKSLSKEHKAKISKANKGRKLPPRKKESIEKQLESRKGYRPSQETRRKISEAQKGVPKSPETKLRMSKAHAGKEKPHKRTPILQLDKETGTLIREFTSFIETAKHGFNKSAVQNACTANKNLPSPKYSSGGYKWIYKD